jgi:hypothetical protein
VAPPVALLPPEVDTEPPVFEPPLVPPAVEVLPPVVVPPVATPPFETRLGPAS